MEYSEIQSGVTVYQKSIDELLMYVPIESEWEDVSIWKLIEFKAIGIDKHL